MAASVASDTDQETTPEVPICWHVASLLASLHWHRGARCHAPLLYRSVYQEMSACWQTQKALVQGLLCLLVHKERSAAMP